VSQRNCWAPLAKIMGRSVFVGDADPSLLRLTPPIEEVEANYWLLVDPKAVPRVWLVMERIPGVFKTNRAALRR
jgi:hypothetical protein